MAELPGSLPLSGSRASGKEEVPVFVVVGDAKAKILTLAGARAQYAGDEVAAKIFADPVVKLLPYSAHTSLGDGDRKPSGDASATLGLTHMIRQDNSAQRRRSDALLGSSRRFAHDPRPLNQQFQEMTAGEIVQKLVDLELEERIKANAPRPSSAAYDSPRMAAGAVLPRTGPVVRAKDLHLLLHASASPASSPPRHPAGATGRRPHNLTAEERLQRLQAPILDRYPQLLGVQPLHDYQQQVEVSTAAVAAATRAAAVQRSREKVVELQREDADLRRAVQARRPRSALARPAASIAALRRASAATATLSELRALSAGAAGPVSAPERHHAPASLEQYTPKPVAMEADKARLKATRDRVRDLCRRRPPPGPELRPSIGPSGPDRGEDLKAAAPAITLHVDHHQPIYLEGRDGPQELEFPDIFK